MLCLDCWRMFGGVRYQRTLVEIANPAPLSFDDVQTPYRDPDARGTRCRQGAALRAELAGDLRVQVARTESEDDSETLGRAPHPRQLVQRAPDPALALSSRVQIHFTISSCGSRTIPIARSRSWFRAGRRRWMIISCTTRWATRNVMLGPRTRGQCAMYLSRSHALILVAIAPSRTGRLR